MRAADLGAARVAIWGLGREGRAAIQFLRARHPELPLLLLDDAASASRPIEFDNIQCAFGEDAVRALSTKSTSWSNHRALACTGLKSRWRAKRGKGHLAAEFVVRRESAGFGRSASPEPKERARPPR